MTLKATELNNSLDRGPTNIIGYHINQLSLVGATNAYCQYQPYYCLNQTIFSQPMELVDLSTNQFLECTVDNKVCNCRDELRVLD
jgi:hypothetical protein